MSDIQERIVNYLDMGGLINPEAMDHAKVRTLIMDAADEICRLRAVLWESRPSPAEPSIQDLQDAFRELIVSAVTDSEACVICRNDVERHASGCPIPRAIAALEASFSAAGPSPAQKEKP